MKKSKITTILMFVFLVAFIVLFIVFFVVADGFKAEYQANNVKVLSNATSVLEKLNIRSTMSQINANYSTFSVLSYVCSILSIATLGIGLALSDKFKSLEEKAAENS